MNEKDINFSPKLITFYISKTLNILINKYSSLYKPVKLIIDCINENPLYFSIMNIYN